MNPFDLDERLREVDDAETRHESEETTRRAMRAPADDEAAEVTDELDETDEEPADD